MMHTYLVHLADRDTGQDQMILVQSATPDDMQEFVERDNLDPPLKIANPKVISIRQLAIKRPVGRTTMQQMVKTAL